MLYEQNIIVTETCVRNKFPRAFKLNRRPLSLWRYCIILDYFYY